jgi:hypothetical protein
MTGTRHAFGFSPSYRLPAALLGITPRSAWVEVGPVELRCRFGPWRLRAALADIEAARRTGGFTWLRTAGPPRLSLADRGITLATNGDDAVCLSLRRPVRVVDPTGRLRHPAATLTVADPGALLDELAGLGVPVVDG